MLSAWCAGTSSVPGWARQLAPRESTRCRTDGLATDRPCPGAGWPLPPRAASCGVMVVGWGGVGWGGVGCGQAGWGEVATWRQNAAVQAHQEDASGQASIRRTLAGRRGRVTRGNLNGEGTPCNRSRLPSLHQASWPPPDGHAGGTLAVALGKELPQHPLRPPVARAVWVCVGLRGLGCAACGRRRKCGAPAFGWG